MSTHVLDNSVWHALNTKQAKFAVGTGLAKRYLPAMSGFAALADESEAAYQDLGHMAAGGQRFAFFAAHKPLKLAGYHIDEEFNVIQMVSTQPLTEPEATVEIVNMTTEDVQDILQLVELTHPGPFFARTIEMGQYLGIRQAGELVAMAGERIHLTGYREISAVCTHPDHQGKGYARLLISRLVNQNWQRGEVPFLHVFTNNARAIQVYESLHFQPRTDIQVVVLSA